MIRISKTISALKSGSGFDNIETVDSVSLHTSDCQKLHNLPAPRVEVLINAAIGVLKTQTGESETIVQKDGVTCRDIITTALYSEAKQELEEVWAKVRINISTDIGGVSFICKRNNGDRLDLSECLVGGDVTVLQKCDFTSKTYKGCYVFFKKCGDGEPDFSIRPSGII